jgi:hypothetical protein
MKTLQTIGLMILVAVVGGIGSANGQPGIVFFGNGDNPQCEVKFPIPNKRGDARCGPAVVGIFDFGRSLQLNCRAAMNVEYEYQSSPISFWRFVKLTSGQISCVRERFAPPLTGDKVVAYAPLVGTKQPTTAPDYRQGFPVWFYDAVSGHVSVCMAPADHGFETACIEAGPPWK